MQTCAKSRHRGLGSLDLPTRLLLLEIPLEAGVPSLGRTGLGRIPRSLPFGHPQAGHLVVGPVPVTPLGRPRPGAVGLDSLDPGPSRFTPQQLSRWEAVTPDPWVVRTLSKGYRLQFRRRPPPFNGVKMTVVGDPLRSQALSQEIKELLRKGAIESVPGAARLRGFYSFYFLIPKKDGSL